MREGGWGRGGDGMQTSIAGREFNIIASQPVTRITTKSASVKVDI